MFSDGGSLNPAFGREFEGWLNDRFYGRERYISLHYRWNALFGDVRENGKAFTGKDGWLFYKGDDGRSSIPLCQNKVAFSETEMKLIGENLRQRQTWLQRQGIAFAVLAAPNKHDVYGEYYKPGMAKVGEEDRIQLLKAFLNADHCPVPVVYPLDTLLAHKANGLLYWKTDTHWCEHGAFIGYLAWMRELQKLLPAAEALPPARMIYEETQKPAGDLTGMLNLKDTSAYAQDVYFSPKPADGWPYTATEEKNAKEEAQKPFIRTRTPGKPYKAVVFRDSFTTSLLPYLSSTFGEVLYVWDHDLNSYAGLILQEKPDIVLWEFVSRYAQVLLLPVPGWQ